MASNRRHAGRRRSSWQARILDRALRTWVKRGSQRLECVDQEAIARSRRRLAKLSRWIPSPPRGTRLEPVDADGVPGEWIVSPGASARHAIVFLHGGGYAVGNVPLYRDLCARMSRSAGVAVLSVEYRLAPEHRFPAALEDALTAWHWLTELGIEARRRVLAGDSAGGGLALAAMLRLRDANQPLPAAAVCMSPWMDLTGTSKSLTTNAETDSYLVGRLLESAARNYLGDADPADPGASPLHGCLRGLPPVLVHASDSEVLLDDALNFVAKARASGVRAALKVWPALPHAFQVFAPVLPEARRSVEELGRFIADRLMDGTGPGRIPGMK